MENFANSNSAPQWYDSLMGKLSEIHKDVLALKETNMVEGNMILNLEDVCRLLHTSRRQAYRIFKRYGVEGFTVGRRRFFLMPEIQGLIKQLVKEDKLKKS